MVIVTHSFWNRDEGLISCNPLC